MTHIVFIAVQGHDRLVEVDLPENASIEIVHATVKATGIEIDQEFILFHDEDDEPIEWQGHKRPHRIKHGAKLHLARCRKIDVTIHYLEQTKHHSFAPRRPRAPRQDVGCRPLQARQARCRRARPAGLRRHRSPADRHAAAQAGQARTLRAVLRSGPRHPRRGLR